jgi:predicted 2-oxoglutarate/Fe(II)-dependent dioxygenase YbiX
MRIASFLPPHTFVGFELVDAVDAAWCDALREELARRGFAATGAAYPSGYRDNDRQVFEDASLATRLFANLGHLLPRERVVDGETWTLHGLNSRFRACRYRDGQAFCIHRDGAHVPDEATRSMLTLQLYLDDASAMSGGRTRFYAASDGRDVWAAISPRRGTAIVFDHRAWHDGEAVTAGEKYVVRTDVMYRRGLRIAPPRDPQEIGQHRGYAWRAIACRNGTIASCGRDGTVRRWRAREALASIDLAAGSVTAMAEAEDGRLWCGTRAGALAMVDLGEDGEAGARWVCDGLGAVLSAVALPAGGVAVGTSRGEIVEVDRDEIVRRACAHSGWAWAVAWRGAVVSCGDDGRVLQAGRELGVLGHPARALAPLPDGSLLVGTVDGFVHRLHRGSWRRWRAHDGAITGLAATPSGAWASCSEDGTVKLWREEHLLRRSPQRADFVTSIAFTADGSLIASGYDGAVWQAFGAPEHEGVACCAKGAPR